MSVRGVFLEIVGIPGQPTACLHGKPHTIEVGIPNCPYSSRRGFALEDQALRPSPIQTDRSDRIAVKYTTNFRVEVLVNEPGLLTSE